jgi:hypothetical protein
MTSTNAQISAAITDAETLGVTPAQMVALLDKAIASAFVSGLAVLTYTINGRSRTVSLTDARALRKYYSDLVAGGGVVFQPIEFAP